VFFRWLGELIWRKWPHICTNGTQTGRNGILRHAHFQGAKGENSALEIDGQTCTECTKLLGAESATTLEKEQALSA
jgi:hypothetical protein